MKKSLMAAMVSFSLIAAHSPVGATTLDGVALSAPSAILFTAINQIIPVKYVFNVHYHNKAEEKSACGARITFDDGTSEDVLIQAPMHFVLRTRTYAAPAIHTAAALRTQTIKGFAYRGMAACLGTAKTSVIIEDSIPILIDSIPKVIKLNTGATVDPKGGAKLGAPAPGATTSAPPN